MHPYKDIESGKGWVIREFTEKVDPIELMWHRDEEERIVEAVEQTDWQIQLEDELPQYISNRITIPKEAWHRLIKGTNSLRVKIYKLS